MLTARVFERIGDVDPARWDGSGHDPFSSHAALSAIEQAGLPGVRMRYATMEDATGSLVACAPFAALDVDAAELVHGLFRNGIRAARVAMPGLLRTRLAICGTPLSVANAPLRVARGADPAAVHCAAAGLLREFAEDARAPWRAFKELSDDDRDAASALDRAGWLVVPSESCAVLALRWDGFDAYARDMRSDYRRKLRISADRLAAAGVVVEDLPLADAYDATHHALYEAVLSRAQVRLEHLNAAFFTALGRAFGDGARLLRFSRDGRVIGWVALVVAGARVHDLFHGIDYAENEALHLYFNQLAETVRFALRRGARELVMGQSTESVKARFGCDLHPLRVALRHSSAAIHALLRAGASRLFAEPEAPRRRVFREAAPTVA